MILEVSELYNEGVGPVILPLAEQPGHHHCVSRSLPQAA